MPYKVEGTVATVHGEDWLIVATLEGGFCLAVRDGEPVPARVYMIYCNEVLAQTRISEVTV